MYGITNDEVLEAMEVFEGLEGIDIVPAAAVAVAALGRAVEGGGIRRDETVLLNITGGGEKRLKMEREACAVKPYLISKSISDKEIEDLLCGLPKTTS
jgi:cysteate synthase